GVELAALTLTGDLALTAGGDITQTGELIIAGTTTIDAGANAITLTNADNDFTGAVSLSNSGANDISLTDSNAIELGTSNIGSGALTITAVGVTQSGAITQEADAGDATF